MSGSDTAARTAVATITEKQPISPEMAAFCSSLVIGCTPCNYCELEGVGFHVSGPECDQIVADLQKYDKGDFAFQGLLRRNGTIQEYRTDTDRGPSRDIHAQWLPTQSAS